MAAENDGSTPYEAFNESEPPDQDRPSLEPGIDSLILQIKETAEKLARDHASRGDVKLLATAMKELRYCFKIFGAYRRHRKVTIFGSARTKPEHPAYQAAIEFARQMVLHRYMVITGAASGIMEAGHVGAGREHSFGVNIILPFEQGANSVILDDPKLMNMRYFFSRKLVFIKESDAVALFPGGFGTHDEGFEALTLIQTGKSHIFPLVLVDEPGGDYWKRWDRFIDEGLLAQGYISPQDKCLYRITDSVTEAVEEIVSFYRNYHSMRYVRGNLVLRIMHRLTDEAFEALREEFQDLAPWESFEQTTPLPQEANEPNLAHLTRLKFRFNRHNHGRLRQLINQVNASAVVPSTT